MDELFKDLRSHLPAEAVAIFQNAHNKGELKLLPQRLSLLHQKIIRSLFDVHNYILPFELSSSESQSANTSTSETTTDTRSLRSNNDRTKEGPVPVLQRDIARKPKPQKTSQSEETDSLTSSTESVPSQVKSSSSSSAKMAPTQDEIDAVAYEQNELRKRITKVRTLLAGHSTTPVNEDQVTVQSEKLKACTDWLQEVRNRTFKVMGNSQEKDLDAIEDLLDEVKTTLQGIRRSHGSSSTPSSSSSSTVKLHKLTPPSFSGEIKDWPSFKNSFESSVKSCSEVDKLQFLQAALVGGKAETTIKSYEIRPENYKAAMNQLKARYEHERLIVGSHLSRFLSIPHQKTENSTGLQHMIDTTTEVLKSLEIILIKPAVLPAVSVSPVEHWDAIIIHILSEKLSHRTRTEWEVSLKDTKVPPLSTFMTFMQNRANALALTQTTTNESQSSPASRDQKNFNSRRENRQQSSHAVTTSNSKQQCDFCSQGNHPNYFCPHLKSLSIPERKKLTREKSICFNCLEAPFRDHKCKRPPCPSCNENIHRLLHSHENSSVSTNLSVPLTSNSHDQSDSFIVNKESAVGVILPTAVVQINDVEGKRHTIRALLDPGSQVNFLSEKMAQQLNLKRRHATIPINGISGRNCGSTKGIVSIKIGSLINQLWTTTFECHVLPKITSNQPHQLLPKSQWKHLSNIPLADPQFHQPGQVDLLVGASVFAALIRSGKMSGPAGSPTALETELGWAVLGGTEEISDLQVHHAELEFDLTRFWSQEEVPEVPTLTEEEQMAEEHFISTHSRDQTGRYVVQLPIKSDSKQLGDSFSGARKRLHQLERRFNRHPQIRTEYSTAIHQLIELGHLERVPAADLNKPQESVFYLPHHFVAKESSSSTKVRIVLDGSAKSSSGVSLNDKLMVGPVIQPELISTLMRFRTHKHAICADIRQMYHQVRVDSTHTDFLRLLWRDSPNSPIEVWRLNKVPFGLSSSPFLAIRVFKQLVIDEGSAFPLAASVLLNDFYVDDLMPGASTTEAGIRLVRELIELTAKGGFELTKWSSSNAEILGSIPEDKRETNLPLEIDSTATIKTLGIHWNPSTDEFSFRVSPPENNEITMRKILSYISKLYDPMGWLQPVIVKAKFFMKLLWELKLGWDDPVPSELHAQWNFYVQNLKSIESIRIPRCVMDLPSNQVELHGFSDASEGAYGAAVYLRLSSRHSHSSHLIVSKSRVAPMQKKTIPRLELMGGLLLAKLMRVVVNSLNLDISSKHYWTDSSIVLHWISGPSSKRKTFVCNRVAKIQELSSFQQWHHVISEENPSDCVSRGLFPSELESHPLWWYGPGWLSTSTIPYGPIPGVAENVDREEKKITFTVHNATKVQLTPLQQATDWNELLTTTATEILRIVEPLHPAHLTQAENYWIKAVQQEVFQDEIQRIERHQVVKNSSPLKSLFPHIDGDGILRVGGRLLNAEIPKSQQQPIILPGHHAISNLIIHNRHLSELHAGPQQLVASLSAKFYILRFKKTIRAVIRKCTTCARFQAPKGQQLMGQLPSSRVNLVRAFHSTGIDYAGPFHLKKIAVRASRADPNPTYKSYVAVFVCMATKAIHLEPVTQLDTPAFIAAFRRFASRRGKPSEMFSDHGKNFEGGDNELNRLLSSQNHNNNLSQSLLNDGIQWTFIPPHAPHMGGLWEAAVKSFKFHLKRVVGLQQLTYEEFYTALTQIEAVLNSRPLVPISTDPNDFDLLTPGHFLVGGPLTALPDPDLSHLAINRLSRWQLVQKISQDFKRRFVSEYLIQLQRRSKWTKPIENIRTGDAAFLMDDNMSELEWPLCRVINTHPGFDGLIRSVTVQTEDGSTYDRPIVKLILLPRDEDQSTDRDSADELVDE